MIKYCIFFLFNCILLGSIHAQEKTIWIVRHAEKDTAAALKKDPPLTALGQQRALDLANYLKGQEPKVIYSTNTSRTKQTAAHFLAKPVMYDPQLLTPLVEKILNLKKVENILIVGHSNTVLETIEAFGGSRPFPSLSDEDYDYIFKLSINAQGQVITQTFHYGAMHHKKVN